MNYNNNLSYIIICWFLVINLIQSGFAIDDELAWREFKQTYGKRYATRADEDYRKQIFLENKHYIEKHNDDKSDTLTFTSGINHLSDLSTEEVNNRLNGFKPRESLVDLVGIENYLQRLNASWYEAFTAEDGTPMLTDNPDNLGAPNDRRRLDWREQGRVMKVKDQGSCGSCWAFAAVGCLEGLVASRGYQILLSEQNLVDCSSSYGNEGCHGGMMDSALKYVRDHGIMSSREYKYTGKQDKCRFNPRRSVISVRGASRLPKGDEPLLKRALNLIGPIPIAVDASLKSFHTYKSGIYNDDKCKSAMKNMSHAVLLVGYGTDRFGRDYWIVKNSWGTSWGERGFMRISRANNLCGVSTYAVVPLR